MFRGSMNALARDARGICACVFLAIAAATLPTNISAQVGRIEVHPLTASTASDIELLTGRRSGVNTTLAAELRFPAGKRGRVPAVVLLHGSGGMGPWIADWVQWLNDLGFATLAVDSFSGRGIVHTVVDQDQLGRLAMVVDAYAALDLLSKHARIDAQQVVVMGFSRGGHAALYASLKRLQGVSGVAGPSFAAFVAFYPPCNTLYRDDTVVADVPIRIFHGGADDWVPVAPCRDYIARLQAAGKDAELAEYPGALHGFDSRSTAALVRSNEGQTTRNCRLAELNEGRVVNAETRQEFTNKDPCVERGATFGYSEAASLSAQKSLRDLLILIAQRK